MTKFKLIALDMDGTLLTEEKTISEQNRIWIHKAGEAGISVCMATGRGKDSAMPYIEELGLRTPIVTVNGSEVWREPGVLHSRKTLDCAVIAELHELAVAYDVWYWAYSVQDVYNKENWLDGNLSQVEWLKFGVYTENETALRGITNELRSWNNLEMSNSHPCNIELNPRGVSKASGLRQVCDLLGIGMKDVVAVGDSLNDVTMIREAGLGVAMGNAQDEVKQIADYITADNEEDGVAQVIRERVLMS